METLQIVHLEKNGIGIFQTRDPLIYETATYNRYVDRHKYFPVPFMEDLNLNKGESEWFCAYITVQVMQQWLADRDIQFLIRRGFKVLLLTVSDFQKGEKQAVYTKESIINQEDITSIFTK